MPDKGKKPAADAKKKAAPKPAAAKPASAKKAAAKPAAKAPEPVAAPAPARDPAAIAAPVAPTPRPAAKVAAPKPKPAPPAPKRVPEKAVKVTQIRSPAGRFAYQRATLRGLGLDRINRSNVLEDTPSVRGMIARVRHLVRIDSGA